MHFVLPSPGFTLVPYPSFPRGLDFCLFFPNTTLYWMTLDLL